MEDLGSYEALSVRDDLSGSSRCLEGLSRASLWWLSWREIPLCVGTWVTLCWRFFLQWVDRAKAIPKVGSSVGNSVVGKFFRLLR